MNSFRRICVFCGSNAGNREVYSAAARELGELLAGRGIGLVYGGGNIGLMGIVADTVMERGGEVTGVIPHSLEQREVAHHGVTELRVVDSMHERKAMMADLADGFIALPGGFGTFEELGEILTWAQLGLHSKPIGVLDVAGYFDHLLALFDHGVAEGFLHAKHRGLLLVGGAPAALLEQMAAFEPPVVAKWIERDET